MARLSFINAMNRDSARDGREKIGGGAVGDSAR